MFTHTTLAAAVAAALAAGSAQAQTSPRFTIENLPTLGGSSGSAAAVNDAGQVVGTARTALGFSRAYVWQRDSGITAIPGPFQQSSSGNAINERGQVAGSFSAWTSPEPFLWTPGGSVLLVPMLDDRSTIASGVNDRGEVVGTTVDANELPTRWSPATGVVRLPTIFNNGTVDAINNAGTAVGSVGGMFVRTPALWSASGGVSTLMDPEAVSNGRATAINSQGQVAGYYLGVASGSVTTPFTWTASGGLRVLQNQGIALRPSGNNDAGLVVGREDGSGNNDTAVAWRADGSLVDLAALTGATLLSAPDVNNHAQIVVNSADRAHLLTLHPDWVGSDGNWADGGNRWNFAGLGAAGAVGAMHDVVINPGISATVRGATQAQAHSLRVGGTAGHVVVLDLNGGTTTVNTRTTLDAGGVLRGQGRHQGDVSVGSLGRIEVGAGQTLQLAGDLAQQGLVDVRAANGLASLQVTGTWAARGQTNLLSAELRADSGLVHDGLLQITGFSQVLGDIDNRSSGRIHVSGAAGEAVFWDTLVNNGSVNVTANSTATFFGEVTGSGTFSGAGTKHFAGGYSPGNSPGRVTLEGVVVFDGGTVLMELAGLAAGSQHDQLVFNDASVLLGSGVALSVALLGGYSPVLGDRFDLFDWNGSLNAASGLFGDLRLPGLAEGLAWDVSRLYLDGDIRVTAVPEPQTWALMALGLMGLRGLALRRRGKTATQAQPDTARTRH